MAVSTNAAAFMSLNQSDEYYQECLRSFLAERIDVLQLVSQVVQRHDQHPPKCTRAQRRFHKQVQGMEQWLISPNDSVRYRATLLLAEVRR